MSSSINDIHRAMAKTSLAMMASVYDDIVKNHKLPSNGDELYSMMTEAIFQDELPDAPIIPTFIVTLFAFGIIYCY